MRLAVPAALRYNQGMEHPSRIHILPPDTAKRIAAGEVIERPASVLRELLDNCLDAGASDVYVEIEGGGIAALRVTDNGCGMNAEELSLSVLPHATSKIAELDDLLKTRTLGFRGEALASVAAVARLEIVSAEREGTPYRLSSFPGGEATVEPSAGKPGTSVRVEALFDAYPARKKFLKRPATESGLCRQVFVDKALPFPDVAFRLASEGRLSLFLPPASLLERVRAAYAPDAPKGLLWEALVSGPGFAGRAVLGDAALARTDRRHSQVFVNGRRVQEFGFLQALDWAFQAVLPGGLHPFAFLFLDVDPALVDFNIHPAKREVRFRDGEAVRRAVSRAIQESLRDRFRFSALREREAAPERGLWEVRDREGPAGAPGAAPIPGDERAGWETIAALAAKVRESSEGSSVLNPDSSDGPSTAVPSDSRDMGFRYLGHALGVFLVYEEDGCLWLLDQHAAHERVLFDRLMAKPPAVQELLVPLALEPESAEEEAWLSASGKALRDAGYIVEKEGSQWLVTGLPAGLRGEDAGAVLELLRSRPEADSVVREAHATTACRAAVKDGDELEDAAAIELIALARALPVPRCPHGRPVRVRFGKDELYRLVKRIV